MAPTKAFEAPMELFPPRQQHVVAPGSKTVYRCMYANNVAFYSRLVNLGVAILMILGGIGQFFIVNV